MSFRLRRNSGQMNFCRDKLFNCDLCEKRLLASSCLSVRLSYCVEQLGSHWTDFDEILYLSIFRKSVERIQVSLKSEKGNG